MRTAESAPFRFEDGAAAVAVGVNEPHQEPVSSWVDSGDVGTDQLSELFKSHGDMTDCGLDRRCRREQRFRFVTYAEKSMAEAAIKALDGHRINGRRIGVRRRRRQEEGRQEGTKGPEGLKLYIGNLPFSATQDQLKEMVAAHATVNEVISPPGRRQSQGLRFRLHR